MKTLAAFYFTGTGNTRYVTERLCKKLSSAYRTELYDITDKGDLISPLQEADVVLFAFPIYGSAPPIPMRQFVHRAGKLLSGKSVILAETQYFFSGDGAAALGRTVEKYGGKVVAAEHFNMPNNLADVKIFPIKNGSALKRTLDKTEKRMDAFANKILAGKRFRRGFHLLPHAIGYFCQRKFWWKDEKGKRRKLKIDAERCVGCGLCVKQCPVANLRMGQKTAAPIGQCVLCYRCVNVCPRKAITLIGSAPPEKQYKGPVL